MIPKIVATGGKGIKSDIMPKIMSITGFRLITIKRTSW